MGVGTKFWAILPGMRRFVGSLGLVFTASLLACADPGGDGDGDGEEAGDTETGGDEGGEPPSREELVDELFAPGPFLVGYQELEISYRPPGMDEDRTIPVLVWYPADADTDAPPVTYAVAGVVQMESENALDDPDPAEGTFPVVVHSHGSGGEGLLAYPYAEQFASHGWVVVSPSHIGNTALESLTGDGLPLAMVAALRPMDIRAVLDAVDDGDGIFASGDTDDVFAFGHSFGGYTTFAVGAGGVDRGTLQGLCTGDSCAYLEDPDVIAAFDEGFQDPRIDALAAQAPAFFDTFTDNALSDMELPTMVQTGGMDVTTPLESATKPFWDAVDGESDIWVNMPTGGHLTFLSICDDLDPELLDLFQSNNQQDGCGPESIPVGEALDSLTAYMMAFANVHVLGDMDYAIVLEEGDPLHPEMEVELKAQ